MPKVDIEASRKLIAAANFFHSKRGNAGSEHPLFLCAIGQPGGRLMWTDADVEFIVAARDPETGWPAALTELEEAEILVAKWEKSCEILANEKIAAVRDWQLAYKELEEARQELNGERVHAESLQLAYKELEEARQELGIFRRDLMVATLGMPSSEDADDEDRVDWLCRIAVEGEVARAELKRRDEPVQVQKQRLSGHSSRIATCECKAVILNGTEKFCPNCGRHLEWA